MTPEGVRLLTDIQAIAEVMNARSSAGISRTDITRTEGVLRRMKAQLIAMDAVPGAANGVAARRARQTADR